VDVDDTLLASSEAKKREILMMQEAVGQYIARVYWDKYELVRQRTGFVNQRESLALLIDEIPEAAQFQTTLEEIIFDFRHQDYRFPNAIPTLRELRKLGKVIIVSDGDYEYQMAKVRRCGLHLEVDGIQITHDKTAEFGRLMREYPADQYVMVDDKPKVHFAFKKECGDRATTILVLKGKYAEEAEKNGCPAADFAIKDIGQARQCLSDLLIAA
jgi:FMN phosphatase YigB (HAD superfamily)